MAGPRALVVVTVDTLRADRLGCHGHPRPTSSWIDRLAREGVQLARSSSSSCFTAPSMASLSTSLLPVRHGVLEWGDRGADAPAPTLARRLADEGYRAAFVSGHGAIGGIDAITDGFEVVVDDGSLDAPAVTERALRWVEGLGDRAFLLWVHYFDPHAPYEPTTAMAHRFMVGAAAADRFPLWLDRPGLKVAVERAVAREPRLAAEVLPDLYDAEIAATDASIGRLVVELDRRFGPDGYYLVLTADHGENLSDHRPYFDHRNALFESLVHVPMIWRGPGLEPEGGPGLEPGLAPDVAAVDLVPTALELLGIPAGPTDQGVSLAARLRKGGDATVPAGSDSRDIFLDSGLQESPHKALRRGESKLVVRLLDGRRFLYDLAEDPGERRPREWARGEVAADSLESSLESWLDRERSLRSGSFEDLDPLERQRLERLGYFRSTPGGK